MAKINLLPWREERRKQLTQEFARQAVLVALLAGLIGGYTWYHIRGLVDDQESRNEYLEQEIAKLDEDIQAIREIEEKKQELLARMDIIQNLQQQRPEIVHLFSELADTVPQGVYLRRIEQQGDDLTLKGRAKSNSRVSGYMRNLSGSAWLENPRLDVIEDVDDQDIKRFTLQLAQTSPDEADGESDQQGS